MIRPRKNHHLKASLALLLIGVMLANAGLQSMAGNLTDPSAIDICDHTDNESECEKKESGETDDIISHEVRGLIIFLNHLIKKDHFFVPGYLSNHTEIVCPPPEYRI